MLKRSISSLLDQVLLSALNFGIAFALIQGIPKAEYGLYVQLSLYGLLVTTMMDAYLGNSFNILNNRPPDQRPADLLGNTIRISYAISALAALTGIIMVLWLTRDWSDALHRTYVILVYTVYLVLVVNREFKRACCYLTERWKQAFLMNAIFASCSVIFLSVLWWSGKLSVVSVFVALAVSSGLATVITPTLTELKPLHSIRSTLELAKKSWLVSNWALPGSVLGWSINNAYLFILSVLSGPGATAEVNATKLAIMPLALTLIAWYQVSRADISRLVQLGTSTSYTHYVRKSFLLMYAPVPVYLLVLYLVYPWMEPVLLKKDYTHSEFLLILWGFSAFITPLKFLGTSLLVGFEAFKVLFKLSLLSLVVQIAGVFFFVQFFDFTYVIVALILADLLEIVIMWFVFIPRCKSIIRVKDPLLN